MLYSAHLGRVILLLPLAALLSHRAQGQTLLQNMDTHAWVGDLPGSPVSIDFVDFAARRSLRATVTAATSDSTSFRTKRFLPESWQAPVTAVAADVYVNGAGAAARLRLQVRAFADFDSIVADVTSGPLLNDQWQKVVWALPVGSGLGGVGHVSLKLEGIPGLTPTTYVDNVRLVEAPGVEHLWDAMDDGWDWFYQENWSNWSGLPPGSPFPGIEPVSSLDGSPASPTGSVYLAWDYLGGVGAGLDAAAIGAFGPGGGELNLDLSGVSRLSAWVRASTNRVTVRLLLYDGDAESLLELPCHLPQAPNQWEEASWLVSWPPGFDRADVDAILFIIEGIEQDEVQTGWVRLDHIMLHPGEPPPPPLQVGRWLAPEPWPVVGIHAAMLPTGEVLHYAYPGGGPGSRAMVWNPTTGLFQDVLMSTDIFCSGHSLLPDGRLFVVGGNDYACQAQGRFDTHIFNPFTRTWTKLADMSVGRWYPTSVTLGDGRVMILSGHGRDCETTPVMEIYDPTGGLQVIPEGEALLPLFPRTHLLPSGKVAFVGPSPQSFTFDPASPGWEFVATSANGWRGSGTSVLVPGEPNAVMIIGGDNDGGPTNTCERIDFSSPTPTWRATGPMNIPRAHANAVLLPDGTVMVVGGGAEGLYCDPTNIPELYDPATETWTTLAPQTFGRMYHSTAVLLPDARVLSAGQDSDESGSWGEVYEPAYLFRGPQPVIAAAPCEVGYDSTLTIISAEAASIRSVVLMGLSVVTHSVNMQQRYVALTFNQTGTDILTAVSPIDGNAAPPGYYMLFIVDDLGVPSRAAMVRLTTDAVDPAACACVVADAPVASPDATIKNRFVTFAGGNPGRRTAIRLSFGEMPEPFDGYAGLTMWVGPPKDVSENGASVAPSPGFPDFKAATLQCDPYYTDWSSMGVVHVFHEAIVPRGSYAFQAIDEACASGLEANFSAPAATTTAGWGDTLSDLSTNPPGPPDGDVSILDVLGVLGRFVSDPLSIVKARADLEPACVDLLINISDALFALGGFQGLGYPFAPTVVNPCDSKCINPLP